MSMEWSSPGLPSCKGAVPTRYLRVGLMAIGISIPEGCCFPNEPKNVSLSLSSFFPASLPSSSEKWWKKEEVVIPCESLTSGH